MRRVLKLKKTCSLAANERNWHSRPWLGKDCAEALAPSECDGRASIGWILQVKIEFVYLGMSSSSLTAD